MLRRWDELPAGTCHSLGSRFAEDHKGILIAYGNIDAI
jgi:hypothetical protein